MEWLRWLLIRPVGIKVLLEDIRGCTQAVEGTDAVDNMVVETRVVEEEVL